MRNRKLETHPCRRNFTAPSSEPLQTNVVFHFYHNFIYTQLVWPERSTLGSAITHDLSALMACFQITKQTSITQSWPSILTTSKKSKTLHRPMLDTRVFHGVKIVWGKLTYDKWINGQVCLLNFPAKHHRMKKKSKVFWFSINLNV